MVDTTTFRSFHRAPRTYLPVAPVVTAESVVQSDRTVPNVVLTDDAARAPFAQELRARRKTVRSAWSLVKAEPQADSTTPFGADIIQTQPIEPTTDHQSTTTAENPSFGLFEEALLHSPSDLPLASKPGMTPSSEPLSPVAGNDRHDPAVEAFPYGAVSAADERPDALVAASDEPTFIPVPHSVPPGRPADLPGEPRHPEPHGLLASQDPWPVEAAPIDSHAGLAPISLPLPLPGAIQPDKGEAGLPYEMSAGATDADASHPSGTAPQPSGRGISTVPAQFQSDPLHLDYQLLGLANPLVCTVIGRLGNASPMRMSVGRSGIYRPEGHRATPWNGLAYEVSSDGRTGLLSGTCILTARGEVAVEALVPGEAVLTLRGPALLPITWIGRSIASAPPVHIEADAFGPGRPSKPLCVGADHLIFIQTDPVPAHTLVNGHSIYTIALEAAELFHIDVGFAEVIFVEGVPVASGARS